MPSLSRRHLCTNAVAAAVAPAVLSVTAGSASASPATRRLSGLAGRFASPPAEVRPKIRYWWPCGEIEADAVETEIRQLAEKGFGGAEIQCMLSRKDPAAYGWGSATLNARLRQALEAGRRYGVRVDLTVGPAWPLVAPGLSPDSPAAAQEIVYGKAEVPGGTTYSGPPPAAAAPQPVVTRQKLVAVHAVRRADASDAKPVLLDRASLTDLTASARDDALVWTAPAGGTWLLLAYWQRGTGQAPVTRQSVSREPSYVVDHFSSAGTDAATDYWDAHVLNPGLRRLLKRYGGDLFEDSLELDSAQHWTGDLPARFRKLCGYSLLDHLPVLFIADIHRQYTGATVDDTPDFAFADVDGARVRADYYRTLTDLYVTEHVDRIRAWGRPLGLGLRAQPYGTTIDSATVSAALDVPETESLGMTADYTDGPEPWRFNGAVHLAGKPVFSLEGATALNNAYGQTWPQVLKHFNAAYAHGVNQAVFHGIATDETVSDIPWPGFSPFTSQGGNGFSETWGPRQPTWQDTRKITDWASRMQFILRQGRPSVDLLVYRQRYDAHVTLPDLPDGFTYDLAGASELEGTRVSDGRLAPDGPAYRALILDRQPVLPVATARLLLSHAAKGLPVIVIGDPPARTPGAFRSQEQDRELGSLLKRLLSQPTVRHLTASTQLPGALKSLGIRAAAEPEDPGLLTARRTADGTDFYFVHNPGGTTAAGQLSLEGTGRPYALDAWTGRTVPLEHYRTARGRTSVPLDLLPGASTVIAVDHEAAPGRHVTDISGGEVVPAGDRPHLRVTVGGTYTVTWDNGRTVRVPVSDVPAVRTVDAWTLDVEDWHRGPDGKRAVTTHRLTLDELVPWSDIPALRDVSGVGTYTTTVTLGDMDGVYLDLGEVVDTYHVTVNGRAVPPGDQVTRRLDLADAVRPGSNTISVRVSTPLRNRLRVTEGFPAQASQPRQRYGLMGPVRLVAYRQKPIPLG